MKPYYSTVSCATGEATPELVSDNLAEKCVLRYDLLTLFSTCWGIVRTVTYCSASLGAMVSAGVKVEEFTIASTKALPPLSPSSLFLLFFNSQLFFLLCSKF